MKAIWTMVSTLAIANLLAIVAIVGWLKSSGRLDAERLREVRVLLSETTALRDAKRAEDAKAKEVAAKSAEEAAKAKEPPVTSAQKLLVRLEEADADKARMERMKQEAAQLQTTIAQQVKDLETQRAALQAERSSYEAIREKHQQMDGSVQFKKTLNTMEGLKPTQVKTILQELLKTGKVDDREQVVAYLNGMQERTRVKVIDEFAKENPALASDLLERLRTRGLVAQVPSVSTAPAPPASPLAGKP